MAVSSPFGLESATLPFEFESVSPDADVTDLVNTFYVVRSENRRFTDMMPAYSAQIMIYLSGGSILERPDGSFDRSRSVTCTAPMMEALPASLAGPLLIAGASLTPLGWQCLADLPADKVNNCFVPSERVFPPETLASLEALALQPRHETWDPSGLFLVISEALTARRHTLRAEHILFVDEVMRWLAAKIDPRVDELYAQAPYSPRTVQRLSRRYFGVAPTALAKRYRAIRAAMLLANPDLSEALLE